MNKNKQTLIQIRFVDLMNKPFSNLYHEVRVSGHKYASSAGNSNAKGLGVWIEKPVGTQLDILVRNPLTKKLVTAKQHIIVPATKGVFRVQAPFSIQTVKLRELAKNAGSYKRSTHKVTASKDEYEVKKGQDLYTIAKMHNTTWQILAQLNKATIKDPDKIVPGQFIKVPPTGSSLTGKTNEKPDSLTSQTHYKVKKGETLSSISQRSGVSVKQLQRMNGIINPTTLQAGQTIKLRSNGSTQTHTTPKSSPIPTTSPPSKPSSKPSSSEEEEGFLGSLLESIEDGLGALGDKEKEGLGGINDAISGDKNDKPAGGAPSVGTDSNSNASSTSGGYTVKSGDTLSGIAKKQGVNTNDLARANNLKLSGNIHPGQKLKIPANGANSLSTVSSSPSNRTDSPVNVITKTSNSSDGTPKDVATTNGACICKAHDLIWSGHPKVNCKFRKKVIEICQDLWPNDYLAMANNLMALMHLETGGSFDPKQPNGVGYYGLIQFGELARTDLKISKERLVSMSAVEQLDWVKKYFELYDRYKKVHSFLEMYLTILYPSTVTGKELKDKDIVFRDNGKIKKDNPYLANKSFMKEKDERKKEGFKGGVTYAWEVSQEIESHYKDGEKAENRRLTSTCPQVVQPPIQPIDSSKLNPLACGGDKHYKRTLKNIEQLHSIYQPYVIKLINEGYKKTGLTWVITDGYRSPESQDKLPSGVTNAGALESYHQYGLAIDVVSVTNGEITYLKNNSLSIEHSKKLGPIGISLGLEWGGSWTRKKDYPHFQIKPNNKTWRDLKPQLLKIGIGNYKNLKFN
ncbi:LysM peptidoglycan-binding domain-containing protein [Psychrobacter maritimus]|uniref:LysM peptidoglycan-binding domain-containing protein n=1 Tax=Psychrobacter maritimus TaxID=256325 RepID=UPI001919ED87|nr:LysM peptidoglycan-binding domain-containing protein [Psychrobacter maritimus]